MKINLKDCDAFDLFLFIYFAMIIAFIFFAGYMLTKHGWDYSCPAAQNRISTLNDQDNKRYSYPASQNRGQNLYSTEQTENRGQRCRAVMIGKVATVHCKRQDNEN